MYNDNDVASVIMCRFSTKAYQIVIEQIIEC